MKTSIILPLIVILTSYYSYSQVCFTYDNAGNRIKRLSCAIAFSQKDKDQYDKLTTKQNLDIRNYPENGDLAELIIYPNPTANVFNLANQNAWIGSSLIIMTIDGKIINSITISDQTIDVSNLETGNYFLILSNATSRKTAKLIITK